MARITSALHISAVMRRVMGEGGFAAILRKGAEEAGAVHYILRGRSGSIALFQPALQTLSAEGSQERNFAVSDTVLDDESLNRFIASEVKFDPDFWLVELDTGSLEPGDLFPVKNQTG